jgi:hypothetical protein
MQLTKSAARRWPAPRRRHQCGDAAPFVGTWTCKVTVTVVIDDEPTGPMPTWYTIDRLNVVANSEGTLRMKVAVVEVDGVPDVSVPAREASRLVRLA